jgi:RNA polymerase sigma-70 factor, ECF subfamily
MTAGLDANSRRWVEQLRVGHPRREQTVARLHDLLRRIALCELSRRRHQLLWITGPEFDDLAHQAADDALVNVLDRLDEFRGLSRFTIWAYKFAMFEVSAKVARHAWRRQPPRAEELHWDQLPDPLARGPADWLELILSDDGRGGADPSSGSGLTGLVDRVETIGGTIQINSGADAGTAVHVKRPTRREPEA